MKLKCQKLKKTIASARVNTSYKKENKCITTLQMNNCLVRKLLEAGQRIGKSISWPHPPPVIFFFVSGHFKNFLNTIYFTPWPTTQGGRGQRFLFKFITGHSRVFLKIFFCLPPPSHIETQWWRAWMWTKPSIFVNWPWTALSKCPLRC